METSQSFPEEIKTVICIGAGYVGSLTMTVFAAKHPQTRFFVFDVSKVLLKKWQNVTTKETLPIVEENLYDIFSQVHNKNLFFVDVISDDILYKADVIFVCVNTPSITNYKYGTDVSIEDLSNILNKGIELSMENVYKCVRDLTKRIVELDNKEMKSKIIIQKSTVALLTLEKLEKIVHDCFNSQGRQNNDRIALVNIPEFLAEGTAIKNLLEPDRVVIGHIKNNKASFNASKRIRAFYELFIPKEKIIELDSISSELTKLLSNAFLAQRLSSINSISELCEKTGANINSISDSVGSDKRIGKVFLKCSMGFGGSCFQKDVLCLVFLFNSLNLKVQANYWSQVLLINDYQRIRVCKKICTLESNLPIAILGLAFKGNIGDVRCSNSIFMLSFLLNNHRKVRLYDPYSTEEDIKNELKVYDKENLSLYNYDDIIIYRDIYQCLEGCGVAVFVNNHKEFQNVNFQKISEKMKGDKKYIFDLYDNFKIKDLEKENFSVFKIGEFDSLNE